MISYSLLINIGDLALLESHLSQRGFGAMWVHPEPLWRSDWVPFNLGNTDPV